jgi:hypothetical protein
MYHFAASAGSSVSFEAIRAADYNHDWLGSKDSGGSAGRDSTGTRPTPGRDRPKDDLRVCRLSLRESREFRGAKRRQLWIGRASYYCAGFAEERGWLRGKNESGTSRNVAAAPEGQLRIAQRFIAGTESPTSSFVPEGRLNRWAQVQVSFQDTRLGTARRPSDQSLGYFHPSLRDEIDDASDSAQAPISLNYRAAIFSGIGAWHG